MNCSIESFFRTTIIDKNIRSIFLHRLSVFILILVSKPLHGQGTINIKLNELIELKFRSMIAAVCLKLSLFRYLYNVIIIVHTFLSG